LESEQMKMSENETTYEWNVYSMKITIKHSLRF
jgi:flagellar basal body rod protein FlgB